MMDMYALLMGGGSGGGGGLPSVTSSDIGKALVVKSVGAEGTTIVPQQTVSFDSNTDTYTLSNGNTTLFTEGDTVLLIIDDITFDAMTVIDDGGLYAADQTLSHYATVWIDNGQFYLYYEVWNSTTSQYETPSSITVKLAVANMHPDWVAGLPVMYDALIKPADEQVLYGDYDTVVAKIGAEEPVYIITKSEVQTGGDSFMVYQPTPYVHKIVGNSEYIRLLVSSGNYYHWNPDGTVTYED